MGLLLSAFRIMDLNSQRFDALPWTSYHAKHPLLHVKDSFQVVGRLLRSGVRSWVQSGLKNCKL